MNAPLANKVFDAETTGLLGSTFDAAWQTVVASGGELADAQVASIRESLAKCMIVLVQQGERNPDRLIENALRRLADRNRTSAPAARRLTARCAGSSL
jgi:hypothetical protein